MSATFVATTGVETAPIQEGSVLYDPKSGKFVMLNRSAAVLWTELSTPRTEDELIRLLGATFPDAASLGPDVREALDHLGRLELVASDGAAIGLDAATSTPRGNGEGGKDGAAGYERPSLRVLDEDELLNIFQMTAAEISVASCWWAACSPGCP